LLDGGIIYANLGCTYLIVQDIQKSILFYESFSIKDLNAIFVRIKTLNIGEVSKIMYLNISSPYYHFYWEKYKNLG